MNRPPLRVAILLDDLVVPAWTGALLRRLDAMEQVDLRLLVVGSGSEAPRERGSLIYRLYEAVDARVWGHAGDGFDADDVGPDLAHVRRLALDAETASALRGEDLDVIVALGGDGAALSGIARHGVWSYDAGGAPLFAEMARRDPVSTIALRRDDGAVLYRSQSATDHASLRRGRSRAYLKAQRFVERRLADLHAHGELATLDPDPAVVRDPAPSDARVLAFAARTWGGVLWRFLERRFRTERWFVAYRRRTDPAGPPVASGGWTEIEPPPGHFFADPFLLEHEGRTWLFYEDYVDARGRAHLAAVEIGADGRASAPQVVLEQPHHLSYPYVFADGGDVYLVPESAESGRVELWRALELPARWERVAVLLEGCHLYDPTLFRRDGRWWMFATLAAPGASPDDELHVYSAPELTGPWTPHPRNPVRSDVRSSRPAGRVIERDGTLLRPAQDGSHRYGAAINWQQVTTLTADDYAEETVARTGREVLPRVLATHTYDASRHWETVDGQRMVRRR